jgi:hypothetical protein
MTNPVSSNPTGAFPPITVPIAANPSGIVTPEWYRLNVALWQRTGGSEGVNTGDVQTTAQTALTTAQAAELDATEAQTAAQTALTAADNATTQAMTANNAAIAAQADVATLATLTLLIADNLSDLSSVPTARANLGLSLWPLAITFDTLPSGLSRYIPITRAVTVPSDFGGLYTYCGTIPTAGAEFVLNYIRGGISTLLGTITIATGGNTYNLPLTSGALAYNLIAGDTLQVITPSPADATLANVGITLSLVLD